MNKVGVIPPKRARWFYLALGVWFLAVAAALMAPAWLHRSELLAESRRQSQVNGMIPAPRGAIYDADGVRLAWSERNFDLFYVGDDPAKDRVLLQRIAGQLPGVALPGSEAQAPFLLRAALLPEEYRLIRESVRLHPELKVLSRTERRTLPEPRLRELLGSVVIDDATGVPHGADGLEAELDETLSGVPGEYQVSVDARGNWIASTWKLLTPVLGGRDARLDCGWEEWMARSGGTEPDDAGGE